MNVNFFVEDILFFKYIGCSTAAKSLFRALGEREDLTISYNSTEAEFDVVHYHTFGPMALVHRKMNRGVSVLTAHSTPRINENNLAFTRHINRQYPKIYEKFDHIITISESCQKEIEEMVPGIPTTLIPNGVDRQYFQYDRGKREEFRDAYNIAEDSRVVLTVAQQTPRKGIHDIMKLSRMYEDVVWVWVGGFPYGILSKEYILIQQMKKKCGKNIIFTGFVPDIVAAYSAADVFCMPSYAETFGLVNLEALSIGLPVVARDIPEFHEIFGESLLYFSNTGEAGQIIHDEALLKEKRNNARAFTEPYDINLIADSHHTLYTRLVTA